MRVVAILLVAMAMPGEVHPQDFDLPTPGARFETRAEFLEYGLPPAQARWLVEGQSIGRHAIPELSTSAVALGAGWRALHVAAGLSQTGDPEVGWTAVAAGVGVAGSRGGIGIRAAARRDRWWKPADHSLGAGVGAEVGLGAWIRPTPRTDVWVSAPQIWQRGTAPPIERGLHIGVRTRWSDMSAWLEQDTRAAGVAPAVVHRAGIGLEAGATLLWVAVRDAPLRASLGLAVSLRWVGVAAEAESHPILGETLRLAVRLGAIRGRAR